MIFIVPQKLLTIDNYYDLNIYIDNGYTDYQMVFGITSPMTSPNYPDYVCRPYAQTYTM